jgi:hypothetical protein
MRREVPMTDDQINLYRLFGIEASTILPNRLYMGSIPPKGPLVERAGFTHLVLCAEEYQPRSTEFSPGLKVLHVPMRDDGQPLAANAERQIEHAAAAVADYIVRGARVLVTCAAGRNRSGIICAFTLARATRISPWRAGLRIRGLRVTPDGAPAMTNPAFNAFALRRSTHDVDAVRSSRRARRAHDFGAILPR